MIKGRREYEVTQSWVRNFEQSLSALDSSADHGRGPIADVKRDALRSQLGDLRAEVAEYERLVSGSAGNVPCDLEDLPGTLIRRRLSMGMSERDVAERLGLEERQVLEYERTDYEGAGYDTMLRVLSALSVDGDEGAVHGGAAADFDGAIARLSAVGVDRRFLNERVLCDPDEARDGALQERNKPKLLARLGALFGWTSCQVLGDKPLSLGPAAQGIRVRGADPGRLHVEYARSMARILGRASRRCGAARGPGGLDALRESMTNRSGPPSFAQLVDRAWGSGIPVMRLASLAFRSACLRGGGPAVVVMSSDRTDETGLMLDLLRGVHCAGEGGECVHAGCAPGGECKAPADEFAYDVLLRGDADGLFRMCLDRCAARDSGVGRNGLPALVEAAMDVARGRDVRPDSLACYVMDRLVGGMAPSRYPAPIRGLQKHIKDWPAVVSDALLARADLSAVNRTELALLGGAVQAGYAHRLPVLSAVQRARRRRGGG